jgi:hypothetical protein
MTAEAARALLQSEAPREPSERASRAASKQSVH